MTNEARAFHASGLSSMCEANPSPRLTHGAVRALRLVLLSIMPFSMGCVRRQVQGDTLIYSPEPWVIAVVALVAIVAVVSGWFLRRVRKILGYLVIAGGLLVLCTTVPGLAVSRTIIDSDHFEWWRGFNHTSIPFDDLAEIVHTKKRVPIGASRHDVNYFDFKKKTGEAVQVQVEPGSDRFFLDAIPEIISRAKRRNVTYTYKET